MTAPSTVMGNIEKVAVDVLIPHPKNPRKGDVAAIAESLKVNGQFQPIVVQRSTEHILAGNHTWKAACSLKWKQIEVVYVDVDDQTALRVLLAANRTADLATYSTEILSEILASLPTPVGTGYDDSAVAALLHGIQDRDADLIKDVVRPPIRVEFDGAEEAEWDLGSHIDSAKDLHDTRFGQEGAGDTRGHIEGGELEKMRVAESIAAMQIQFEQFEGKTFPSSNYWGIPDLLPSMLVDTLPDPLDTWGGEDATPDDGVTTWIWNTGVAASKGLPWDRAILSFFCADETTEALTQRGWLTYDQITTNDVILSMDPKDGVLKWSKINSVFRKPYDGKMHRLTGSAMDALVTPGHKFATVDGRLVPVEALKATDGVQTMGSPVQDGSNTYTDSFVELVGWAVTEGSYRIGKAHHGVTITQVPGVKADRIEHSLKMAGAVWSEHVSGAGCRAFAVRGPVANAIVLVAPEKVLSHEFLLTISPYQRNLLVETMIDGDGWRPAGKARQYCQTDVTHTDAFVMLCALAGIPTSRTERTWKTSINGYDYDCVQQIVTLKVRKVAAVNNLDWHGGRGDARKGQQHIPTEDYAGIVWCPSTEFGTWVCRRNGKVYVTGNTYDTKFQSWFDQPSFQVARLLHNGCKRAIVPDTSFWTGEPRINHLSAQYSAQWLARFMQECGVKIIPRFMWCDLESVKYGVLGIPKKPPIAAVCIQAIDKNEVKTQMTHEGLRAFVKEIQPEALIVYGAGTARQVAADAHLPKELHVVHVENYAGKRRGVVFDNATGKEAVEKAARKQERERKAAEKVATARNSAVAQQHDDADEEVMA